MSSCPPGMQQLIDAWVNVRGVLRPVTERPAPLKGSAPPAWDLGVETKGVAQYSNTGSTLLQRNCTTQCGYRLQADAGLNVSLTCRSKPYPTIPCYWNLFYRQDYNILLFKFNILLVHSNRNFVLIFTRARQGNAPDIH